MKIIIPALLATIGIASGNSVRRLKTYTTKNEIVSYAINPCVDSGLYLICDGSILIKTTVTENRAGGTSVKLFQNLQGVKCVDPVTGDSYNAIEKYTNDFVVEGEGFTREVNNNFKLVGPGPANNYFYKSFLFVSVDEEGNVLIDVTLEQECK
jgi:hypothetical protein